jgi:hypothetical protein
VLHAHGVASGDPVLDAACGIGTQTLGLIAQGFALTASDLSPGAVTRLQQELDARGLHATLRVDDRAACGTACSQAATPLRLKARCGTIPSVQPQAVTRAARRPCCKPATMVSTAPVPGEATISKEVSRKVGEARAARMKDSRDMGALRSAMGNQDPCWAAAPRKA